MKIQEILSLLVQTAQKHRTSAPYITGGVPRDKLLNKLQDIEDLDITTGDDSVHTLAREFARTLEPQGAYYKVLGDGHAQVQIGPIKVDFSSNYRAPGIDKILQRAGLKDPDEMRQELYSRDFTVNSLIMTPDLKVIKDPTGLGLNDLKKKRLRTNLPARMTLGNDNKRVIRIIYLVAKLGFEADPEIIEWVKTHPETIKNVKPKYLSDKLQQAIDYDLERTVKLLDQMNLWQHIPPLPVLMSYMKAAPGRI